MHGCYYFVKVIILRSALYSDLLLKNQWQNDYEVAELVEGVAIRLLHSNMMEWTL